MKFKTIVLTKRSAAAVFACILCALALAGGGIGMARRAAVPTFNMKKDEYEHILSKALPPFDKSGIDLDKIKDKILGFDTEEGETIIRKYGAAFDRTTLKEDSEAQIGEANAGENTAPPTEAAEAKVEEEPQMSAEPLPNHEQICAAGNLKINNPTSYSVNLSELCMGELSIKPNPDAPTVLVMHTHTTECYMGDEMSGETERTTDETKNVIAVGNEICSVLESYGIKTIHDTTYHDYPSYQGSYSRALTTIDSRLKENPSVNVVLDVHRDAFVYEDGSRLRVECEENGVKTAQVMLVVGTDSMGLWHDNWRENLKFAAKIQNSAEIMYPGIMRPINLRIERFNQHMTLGSLILEVGSNGNTLEEAREGGRDIARAIAAALING